MRPDLHLHPERLRGHAAAAAGLSEELRAALHGAPVDDPGEEPERLRNAVGLAVRELAELSAALSGAATAVHEADVEVRAALGRVGRHLGPDRT
ncbi:MAG TPA: hypothetical protein VD903_17175 [Pseudonocardia sp.]|nr:hypothetical protein [Pseudonocardia sp.]